LPGWRQLTDYQLCYWYVREIEFRQAHYRRAFSAKNLDWLDLDFDEISDWITFEKVSAFVAGGRQPDRSRFDQILTSNQNPRAGLLNGAAEMALPDNLDEQEQQLDDMIARRADFLAAGRDAA
jgi:hypothetical protein